MVPKIAGRGKSFRGAAAYYLHDKGATTSERVAWVEMRNLATRNPETAWKVMAATAMKQDDLKAAAGIKSTGRKSKESVLAYSLAWHPDEKQGLSRDEMVRAANDSLEALGASGHQCLIVCHSDEPHPHVHILLNRVSPIDGRMLSSSNEKLNLSRWAQAYEEQRGKIWCEERVANNHARDELKEFTRGSKDKPRHIFEMEQKALARAEKAIRLAEQTRTTQREKDRALAKRGREMHDRHRSEWAKLSDSHRERKSQIEKVTREAINRTRHNIRERDREKWRGLFSRQFEDRRAFAAREEKLGGKLQNAIEAIKTGKAVRGDQEGGGRVREAFNYLTSSKARTDALEKRFDMERKRFVAAQRKEIRAAIVDIRADRKALLTQNLERFYAERQDIRLRQDMDKAALRASWHQRTEERKEAWAKVEASQKLRADADRAFSRQRTNANNEQSR